MKEENEEIKTTIETITLIQHTVSNIMNTLKEFEDRMHDMELEIESMYDDSHKKITQSQLRELQKEVAKLADEPIGMLFTRLA